jgi:membrane fusion protein, copper/silver efflux system
MKRTLILIISALLIGFGVGWLFFHSSGGAETKPHQLTEEAKVTIWTCAMHPNIRMEEPGKCPICGMDLIPLIKNGSPSIDPDAIHLSSEAAQLANVLTSVAVKQKPVKELRLYGKIQADERSNQNQVAHVSGRIEHLSVSFTGESVSKGQVLGQIYSPDLITAQQELLEAAKSKVSDVSIYMAAKEKLLQWKLTESQISKIEESQTIQNTIDIVSNTSGIIIKKLANTGDYISKGSVLFEIADLSKVWVMFEAYESDLQFLSKGEKVSFTLQSLPGKKFSGLISFIDPVVDPVMRVARVRVEADNSSGKLKPEMFATGIVTSTLWEYSNNIVIPRSAVLWTGKRSIVYVKQSGTVEPAFKLRVVELGPMLGESYIITDGLRAGEEIVTSGTFSVDAASQLEGKPSMMNVDLSSGTAKNLIKFHVSGLCEMCKDRIQKAALSVSGVKNADWDIKTKMISFNLENNISSTSDVQEAIAKAGHDTDKYKAEDKIYNALPECCLYRK